MTIQDLEELSAEAEQKGLAAPRQTSIPKTIRCPKCNSSNLFSSIRCSYCSYQFKEKDYFDAHSLVNTSTNRNTSKRSASGTSGGLLWGGLFLTVGGGVSVVYGYLLKHNFEFQQDSFGGNGVTAPKIAWVIIGMVAAATGLLLLILSFFRKKK